MLEIIRIRDIGEIYTGKTPPTDVQSNFGNEFPFITPGDLSDEKYIRTTERSLSTQGIKYSTKIPASAICVACIGSTIGKIGLTIKESCTNQQINSIIVNDNFDVNYAYYLLSYNVLYFKELAGVNAVPQLNKSDFSKVKLFATTSKSEQAAIASILNKVDAAIASTKNSIVKAERLKKALMQNLFTGKLKPDGTWRKESDFHRHEKFGNVPKGWKYDKLETVLSVCQYGINASSTEGGDYPMFRMNNIVEGKMIAEPMVYINLSEKEFEKYKVLKNDILLNRTNSLELVGKLGIFKLERDFVFASYLIRLSVNDQNCPDYVNYYLNSYNGQFKLRSKATPSVSQANINAGNVKKLIIPIPQKEEQEKIAKKINSVDTILESKQSKIKKLERLKKALMQNLLTEKVRMRLKEIVTG